MDYLVAVIFIVVGLGAAIFSVTLVYLSERQEYKSIAGAIFSTILCLLEFRFEMYLFLGGLMFAIVGIGVFLL